MYRNSLTLTLYMPFNQQCKQKISIVEGFIEGVFYPASKNELVNQAKINHAPKEIIKTLKEIKEKSYYGTVDIKEELAHHIK